MLYIFGFEGAPFIKIGFTRVDVWMRAANGFWGCNHPSALCRQLGFERLRLLGLFNGTFADEQMVHQMIPGPNELGPKCEFYDAVWEKPVLLILAFLLTELPQPPKPPVPPQVERAIEYLRSGFATTVVRCSGGGTIGCSTRQRMRKLLLCVLSATSVSHARAICSATSAVSTETFV